ncbi:MULTISPECIES: TetR/AcrR family transcriptional regulator [Amycolatopsis]|uniref:TetR/AcrR family transcriptional regulator n=1 Tax=Amycolatopsis thermalba TaxID=944492 RepID=A0ABY4NV26_9PSEU|nr:MULTISPECIES: TetR/AcrR family transcriptional regulator [Amycolatopsis]OXM72709.1 TetR family transcriptional regulator [Amycolatopsis sp. KNN50.9b]UQS23909.1 TetR/AcrR family transcriptional regulator [Amycolatopsis thermalba]
MTTQQVPGRRDPRLDRSRSAILSAAVALLAEGGVRAVTIEAVTSRSGVARSTLYRHFPNNTELLAAAFQELLPPLDAPAEGTPRDRLLRLVLAQAAQIEGAPAMAALVWMAAIGLGGPPDEGERGRLAALRDHVVDTYRRPFDVVLADCLPGDPDVDFAAARLVGPLLFNALILRRPSDEAFCARLVDDFLARP